MRINTLLIWTFWVLLIGLPAVRDADWKLLINEDGSKPQLYDLSKDVGESHNLAGQYPEIVERLKKMVLEWRQSLPVIHRSPPSAPQNIVDARVVPDAPL